ncbi:kinase-like protein, partial [Aaosphaeria arxii CBS 175.79]
NAEAVDKYGPGLFHPVYLGDVYKEGRYRIEQKLGFGSQATIWGARDLPSNELVALKIFAANLSQNNKELAILQRLRDSTLVHPGREHVVEFLDYFYHDGVNGRHLVIVTKPLKQTLFYYTDNIVRGGRAVGEYTCSAFCRQLLLAVDFLH